MSVVTLGLLDDDDDDDIVIHHVSKNYFVEIGKIEYIDYFARTLIKWEIMGWVNSSVRWVVNGCKELVA